MTGEDYKSVFHELYEMSKSDIPPRSADELWELAKEKKKMSAGREEWTNNQATNNNITVDPINLEIPEEMRHDKDSEFYHTFKGNTLLLLNSAKESGIPILPLPRTLQILPCYDG
jgi:hypothetical protein